MMACTRFAARLALAIVVLQGSSVLAGLLRGVDPAVAHLYDSSSGGGFSCRDGSKSVPFDHVNDNYCDCFDGSDEPGTSACGGGTFYCANIGYEPKVLASSFVDDGVCDCCDGSDEAVGCRNTCVEKGLAALDSLRKEVAVKASGLATKKTYIDQAAGIIAGWKKEVEELEPQIAAKQKETDDLKAALDIAEAREKEERDRQQAIEQAKREEEERQRKLLEAAAGPTEEVVAGEAGAAQTEAQASEQAAAAAGEQAEAEPAAVEAAAQAPTADAVQQPAAVETAVEGGAAVGAGGQDQAATGADDEDPEELGRRIASQWISDSHEATGGATPDTPDAVEEHDDPEPDDGLLDYDHDDYPHDHTGDFDDDGDAYIPPKPPGPPAEEVMSAVPQPGFGHMMGILKRVRTWVEGLVVRTFATKGGVRHQAGRSAGELRADHSASSQALSDLKNRKSELEKKLAHDYGAQAEFAVIAYKCSEGQFDKYTYEVCLYADSHQKEGSSSTKLGKWKGFEDNYTVAIFDHGQHCWQGPNRSLKVTLVCSATDTVNKVEEPSRCEYTAVLETPAACQQDEVDDLKAELARREKAILGSQGGAADAPHDEL